MLMLCGCSCCEAAESCRVLDRPELFTRTWAARGTVPAFGASTSRTSSKKSEGKIQAKAHAHRATSSRPPSPADVTRQPLHFFSLLCAFAQKEEEPIFSSEADAQSAVVWAGSQQPRWCTTPEFFSSGVPTGGAPSTPDTSSGSRRTEPRVQENRSSRADTEPVSAAS